MVATRLGRRALTRRERVEGHRERWEDAVARRARIVADTVRRRSVGHLGRMGPAGLLLVGRGGREGGVRWTPVRARAYRKPLMLMRVVVGLLVSRRRVGALELLEHRTRASGA